MKIVEESPPYMIFAAVAVMPGVRHETYRWADGVTVEQEIHLPDGYSLAFPTGKQRYSRISRRDDGEAVEYRLEAPRPGEYRIHQFSRWVWRWKPIRLISE